LKQKTNSAKSFKNFVFKRGLSFLILLVFNANFYAQKIIEKSLITSATNFIFEFDIIDQIVINESPNFNKVTVSAETVESGVPDFILEEKNGNVFIKNIEVAYNLNDEKIDNNCKVQPIYTSFKIMIPKGKNVFLSYLDGNFYLNNFDGKLKLILNDGIVNLNGFKGSVDVILNGGNVYCTEMKDTKIDISSNMGVITSSLITGDSLKRTNQLKGVYGNNLNELNVNAITANIHLK
jgi:hypothetical protein